MDTPWYLSAIVFVLGVIYGYIAAHNAVVMAVHYAGHVWFGKPKEGLGESVMHILWIITGAVWSTLFIGFAFLEGLRLGS